MTTGGTGAQPGTRRETQEETAASAALSLDPEERELIRSLILADPELVLSDDMVMRALIGAGAQNARNIVDLRDKLVERLEGRLKQLVHTNRSVIAAAYENVAGTRQLHRAVLGLVDAADLPEFLRRLTRDVPAMVGVDEGRLCLEAEVEDIVEAYQLAGDLDGRVLLVPEGTVAQYFALDGEPGAETVVLRPCGGEAELVFGPTTATRSEALIRLDLGTATGLIAFGASDPDRFGADQGTELLTFFGDVVERLLARHLDAAGVA